MYQRFKRGLFIPSELSLYLKDSWLKVWVYFFLLLLLASLPLIMLSVAHSGLSNSEKVFIKENYTEHLSSNHQIEDGKLIVDPLFINYDKYLRVDVYTIGIINTPTSPEYQGIRLIFIEDGVRLTNFRLSTKVYTYEELGLKNFDFSNNSTENIDLFIKAIQTIALEQSAPTKVFKVLITLISTFIELMFFVLISASFSRHVLPFKYKFKIAVYVLTIYIVMSLFGLFLNNGLFIFLGIILMMIYMQRAFSKLTIV